MAFLDTIVWLLEFLDFLLLRSSSVSLAEITWTLSVRSYPSSVFLKGGRLQNFRSAGFVKMIWFKNLFFIFSLLTSVLIEYVVFFSLSFSQKCFLGKRLFSGNSSYRVQEIQEQVKTKQCSLALGWIITINFHFSIIRIQICSC